uniref:Uncharacterized protein n=1 Tax=Mycena chlorophos TaxID=658473 RepID=A0ABQ0L997_MYCCL|nr:predicted protein [Mycena chlorophos]
MSTAKISTFRLPHRAFVVLGTLIVTLGPLGGFGNGAAADALRRGTFSSGTYQVIFGALSFVHLLQSIPIAFVCGKNGASEWVTAQYVWSTWIFGGGPTFLGLYRQMKDMKEH